jgi:hypothetical protein
MPDEVVERSPWPARLAVVAALFAIPPAVLAVLELFRG